ncbi:MAG: hypothetical protein R3255_03705 [Candidatus Lokiarchaeia archaeon]|nr:hypothetical protein [Candidatus Lokiarchaeia archaeon]
MSHNQIFNLEKIKELTSPFEDLQIELNQINDVSSKITKNMQLIEHESYNKEFSAQITIIQELLQNIKNKIDEISNTNLNRFLDFQNKLIIKYKELFKDKLKNLSLNRELTKSIGLNLVQEKKISKIIEYVSFVPSIEVSNWLEIIDSLKYNTIFLKSIKKAKNYYSTSIQLKLKEELSRIPKDIPPELIIDYKTFFKENPTITFNEFFQTIEKQLTKQELKEKRAIIKEAKEKEKLEKLKKRQEEQKIAYENYLKLSDSEFKRLRRKKSREKLSNISKKTNENSSIEISEEISEKIKKFKSQFEKSFNEKYMIQTDEDKDPIDLIRERKKRKDKEYKQFEDHFENK